MIRSLLQAYKRMDPVAKNPAEILLLYPGVKALFFHRLAHPLYLKKVPFLPRLISELSRWITGIDIHPGAKLGNCLVIDHGMGTVIGETAEVGNNVLIYHGVTLGSTQLIQGKRHPNIQDGVVLGAGCKILGNITIGKNSRVGANSVVLQDLPPHSIAVGVPARIILKDQFPSDPWFPDYQI